MYTPEKDPKVKEILKVLDEIGAEEHLPVELQVQRLAFVRDNVKARVHELKAQV